MQMKRNRLYQAGVIVQGLSSLNTLVSAFPFLLHGPSAMAGADGVPEAVIVMAALLSVAGIVSAFGAWYGQKWGIWLTIFVQAIQGLLALPGVLFAPTASLRLSAIQSVVVAIFVIFALLYRPKPAIAPQQETQ